MADVILRTALGTLLCVAFLWLVRIDDWRIAGMLLTFPMLNGIGLAASRENAVRLARSMVPVITLNGTMCFLFALALSVSATARANPLATTAVAGAAWLAVYTLLEARDIAFRRSWTMLAYVALCAAVSALVTWALWPPCAEIARAVLRAGGLVGVLEGWVTIALFALTLLLVLGFAHFFRDAHAAIGRLAALPIVPLFGLYTVATVTAGDPAALAKLDTLRSLLLVGWSLALAYAVLFAIYVARAASAPAHSARRVIGMLAGWGLCLTGIVAAAMFAADFCAG
jgi:hypothetical protein